MHLQSDGTEDSKDATLERKISKNSRPQNTSTKPVQVRSSIMQEGKRQSLLVVLNREIVQYIDTGTEFINYCIAIMMNKDCLLDITIPQCNFNRWIKNVASKRHVMFDVVDGII